MVWLHLVAPYGYLGMFPWESLLLDCFPNAILRLPNFVVEAPQQTSSVIDIALCCKQGVAETDLDTANIVAGIARAMASIYDDREVRIYVFADEPICALLNVAKQRRAASLGYTRSALTSPIPVFRLFFPKASARYSQIPSAIGYVGFVPPPAVPSSNELLASASDPVLSPWLRSIRKILGQQSVDVVHVLAHSTLSLERGVLLLDQTNPKVESAHLSLASEFLAFQAQTGAWVVGLSSPVNNYCDIGMRQFADGLAQLRPGPLLYHDLSVDPGCSILSDAYRFLLSEKPSTPPLSRATFAYCEPFRVLEAGDTGETIDAISRRYARFPGKTRCAGCFFRRRACRVWSLLVSGFSICRSCVLRRWLPGPA